MTLRRIDSGEAPNTVWPTDNGLGIPALLLEGQGLVLDLPLARWGRQHRKSRMRGTWHFYTEDYRFSGLWSRPTAVVDSAAVAAVEPNWSVHAQTPRAVAIWQTFRKRWLARYWQASGMRIWVDLYVDRRWRDENLLGVPFHWASFATRGSSRTPADLEEEVAHAELHTQAQATVLVYGGSRDIVSLCQRRGWLQVPEEATAVSETVDGRHPHHPASRVPRAGEA